MSYNKKLLQEILDRVKKPGRDRTPNNKEKKPIVSSRGQWDHPSQRTIVPTPDGRITMKPDPKTGRAINYPVWGQDETGYGQMMYPGQDYQFPGQMVDEQPIMQNGGWLPQYQRRGQVPDGTYVAPKYHPNMYYRPQSTVIGVSGSAEPKDTRHWQNDRRAKERGDELWDGTKKITAVGQYSPEPFSRYVSMALNSLMGAADAYDSHRQGDILNRNINLIGAIPIPGFNSLKSLGAGLGKKLADKAFRAAVFGTGVDLFGTGADLTDNYGLERKQRGGQYAGNLPKAQVGTMVTPLDFSKPLGTLQGASDVMSAPARTATYLLTGKYQDPSQALGINNPWGAFAADMLLDPMNLVGAGLVSKIAKGKKVAKAVSNIRNNASNPSNSMGLNQLPPSPSEIRFMPDGTTREIYNLGPEDYVSGSYRPDYPDLDLRRPINGHAPGTHQWNLLNQIIQDGRIQQSNWQQISIPDNWSPNSSTSFKSKPVNKSGLTKEEVLAKASSKDKDIVSKMSETEFENTVLKPNGEIVPYYQGSLDPQFVGSQTITPLSRKEYVDQFNSKLDLLNNIIAQRNKSGINYKVKGLDENGALTFYTPPGQKGKNPLIKRGLKDVNIPEGESIWDVRLNPGQWKGNVEDIANKEYFRSIPGLEMSNTMGGVFPDRIPRKGTGTYDSINDYLKQMNLGRVKPGFNSQTEYSRGLWENAVNKGKAVGYYNNPGTVYGTMKSIFPYAGVGALGAQTAYGNYKNSGQYNPPEEYQNGGQYVIKSGDTLGKLAKQFGTTVRQLATSNNIADPNRIQINQKLIVPASNISAGNSASASYQDWNAEKTKLDEWNALPNEQMINQYYANRPDEGYVVVDKKNARMNYYKGKNLVKSYEVGVGENAGDAQTVTKVNKNKKTDWNAGNKSTGAGVYSISNIDPASKEYYDLPSFNMKNDQGIEVATSIHGTPVSRRSRFNNNQIADNRMSNGCINGDCRDLKDMYKRFDVGTRVYILPEDEGNRFQIVDGKPVLKVNPRNRALYNEYVDKTGKTQKGQGVNQSVNTINYKPIQAAFDEKQFKEDVFTTMDFNDEDEYNNSTIPYYQSLVKNKQKILKAAQIPSDIYNELAKMSFGIYGTESNYGDTHSAFGNLARAARKAMDSKGNSSPDVVSKATTYRADDKWNSVGYTQLRWAQLNDHEKNVLNKLGITSNKDFLDPEKAAMGTTAILAVRYNEQLDDTQKKDMWKHLPQKWNKRSNYSDRVKENSKYLNFKQLMETGGNLYYDNQYLQDMETNYKKGGEMIRRADGSYSQRGLWDNIRANKGSGKKPTKEMLKQERNIKAKEMKNGGTNNPGFYALPEFVQANILANMGYGGMTYPFMQQGGEPNEQMTFDEIIMLQDRMNKLRQFVGGGGMEEMANGGYFGYDGKRHMSNTPTWSGNAGYQNGGPMLYGQEGLSIPKQEEFLDYESYAQAMDEYYRNYADAAASMEQEQLQMQQAAEQDASNAPMPRMNINSPKSINYQGPSVVDMLTSIGKASDYNSRKQLATQLGITNYSGSPDQNKELMRLFRNDPSVLNNYKPKNISTPKIEVENDEPVWTDQSDMPEIVYKAKRKSKSIFNNPNVKSYSGPIPEQAELRPSSTTLKGTSSKLDPYGSSLIRRDGPLPIDNEVQAEFRNKLLSNAKILSSFGLPVGLPANLALSGIRPAILAGAIRMSPLVNKATQIIPKAVKAKAITNVPKNTLSWADKLKPSLQRSLERVRWDNLSMADKLAAARKGSPTFKKDGGIHINPANKGKFTASAQRAGMGVQEFAQHVMGNREDYSTTQIRRANFAHNAAKWNKEEGGLVAGDEMDVTPEQLEMLRAQGYQFEMI